ncbi:MAG TPA: protein jag [Chloroflexi bacterium]|nr:protein jag [Chloroflexota bacterium]
MQKERRSVETAGRTADDALAQALEELGVDEDQVEVEVLAEGSRGLLGLGAEEARVRVTLIQPGELPIEEEAEGEDLRDREEVAEIASQVLADLLYHMGVQATVSVRGQTAQWGEPLVLDVQGEDLGILIGRQGDTLRDLQYITRLIVSRKLQRWANVLVDVGGYKQRRERVLIELAERMSDRVMAEHRAVSLEPMPAHERRIIHVALRDHPSVTTESTGEGRRRKVVILPKSES